MKRRMASVGSSLVVALGLFLVLGVRSARSQEEDPLLSAPSRIEKIRKSPVQLRVGDAAGKPVAGAIVRVEQRRHAFLFGCNIFPLFRYRGDKHQTYIREFSALMNYATLPFYWGQYEPQPGKTHADELMRMAEWCKAYGIETKGHPLVWHEADPRWAPSDPDETRAAEQKRVHEIVAGFRGLIDRWDVVNEATAARQFDNGVAHWIAKEGAAEVVEEALEWARQSNPAAQLVYNDYKLGPEHEELIARLVRDRAAFDVIGIQSHMHREEWTLEKVWKTCETYARYGKPLHFTEVTVLSGEHGWERPAPWPTTAEGEQRQAEYVEKLYTLLFSHPAVEAITWWDFVDGVWQGAPAGLVRADLSPKPAYDRLMRLIKDSWWTRLSLITDAEGQCQFEGYRGDYEVHVQKGQSSQETAFTLQKGLNTWEVRLH